MKVNSLLQTLGKHTITPKRRQVDEEKLSLPVIYQRSHINLPKTSLNKRKQRKSQKYVSQTTLSPQQQVLHDQLRFALGQNKKRTFMPDIRKHNNTVLNANLQEKQTQKGQNQKRQRQKFIIRRTKSTPKQKNYLAYILDNRNSFIQSYFAQIQHNLRKK